MTLSFRAVVRRRRLLHELAARRLMARTCANRDRTPRDWKAVHFPEAGFIYDWADPDTGKVGQCWTEKHDATKWKQEPLGTRPVVLEFKPRKGRSSS